MPPLVPTGIRYVRVAEIDPYARGVQIGTACTREIRASIAAYVETFHHYAGIDWSRATAIADTFRAPVADYAPAILREMEGIAAGAGVELKDVLAINARTEIMFGLSILPPPECTSFYVGPSATRDRRPLLGQNWDWRARAATSTTLLEVDGGPDAPAFAMYAEAGLVGKLGFNAAGIGLAQNALVTSLDRGQPGVPIHVVMRSMLEASTLEQAATAVLRAQRAASANYLIADARGHAIDLEAGPGGIETVSLLHPTDDILTHSNHFTAPPCPFEDHGAAYPDSLRRNACMRELIAADAGSVTPETMQSVLRSHEGAPIAICCHPDETKHPLERPVTVFSWIVDLERRTADIAQGNPCEAPYQPFRPAFADGVS